MPSSPSRRSLVLAGLALPFCGRALPAWAVAEPATLAQELAALEASVNGRIGVALINTATGKTFEYRGDERFAFCSTFKLIVAAAVLHQSQSQPGLMARHVSFKQADLLSWAPIARTRLKSGMNIAELCAAALQYSDNTATNLLVKELGGLAAVNRFAQSLGDPAFRLDRWEPDLNSAIPDDPRDTTTPMAMASTLDKLVFGQALAPAQREQLTTWLKGNTTGDESIRAGLPPGWIAGDKTGAGDYGTTNDVAALWPPTGAPLVLAIYFTQDKKDAKSRRDVLAAATRLVIKRMG
ncbi:class A beta-lactamase BlaA [Thauera terpenica]|jgi:beta-lactamase class A